MSGTGNIIFSPPVALLIYLLFVGLIYGFGRKWAEPSQTAGMKLSTYSSGEAPPAHSAIPGYRPFMVIALFFAVVHLGALVLASGQLTLTSGIYLAGLFLTLLVLILG